MTVPVVPAYSCARLRYPCGRTRNVDGGPIPLLPLTRLECQGRTSRASLPRNQFIFWGQCHWDETINEQVRLRTDVPVFCEADAPRPDVPAVHPTRLQSREATIPVLPPRSKW